MSPALATYIMRFLGRHVWLLQYGTFHKLFNYCYGVRIRAGEWGKK